MTIFESEMPEEAQRSLHPVRRIDRAMGLDSRMRARLGNGNQPAKREDFSNGKLKTEKEFVKGEFGFSKMFAMEFGFEKTFRSEFGFSKMLMNGSGFVEEFRLGIGFGKTLPTGTGFENTLTAAIEFRWRIVTATCFWSTFAMVNDCVMRPGCLSGNE
jgi:hypothetical protein